MTKFKYNISNKNLSWEKIHPKICDKKSCKNLGEFRAPKSRSQLNAYYYFCLIHIKEYNKSWDFYKGLSVSQIELSMRKDTVWDRPSWPLKGNPSKVMDQIDQFLSNDYSLFEKDKEIRDFLKNKTIDENLTNEENKSLKTLELKMPINAEEIKKKYKKLVKIFHPDVNTNNKKAEIKFKEITEAYRILLKKFLKND
jgi:curved DNA-binding protein CbpA